AAGDRGGAPLLLARDLLPLGGAGAGAVRSAGGAGLGGALRAPGRAGDRHRPRRAVRREQRGRDAPRLPLRHRPGARGLGRPAPGASGRRPVTASAESPRLRVALGEYDIGWHDPSLSLSRAAALAERAAEAGAELVVLPEMCTTGFTMRPAEQAEPLSGPGDAGLAGVAARSGVHLLAGVATRTAEGGRERYHNSALLFGPDGSLRAEYRKQRLFAYAGEHEAYSAGGAGTVWEVAGVRIAPFICY